MLRKLPCVWARASVQASVHTCLSSNKAQVTLPVLSNESMAANYHKKNSFIKTNVIKVMLLLMMMMLRKLYCNTAVSLKGNNA